ILEVIDPPLLGDLILEAPRYDERVDRVDRVDDLSGRFIRDAAKRGRQRPFLRIAAFLLRRAGAPRRALRARAAIARVPGPGLQRVEELAPPRAACGTENHGASVQVS